MRNTARLLTEVIKYKLKKANEKIIIKFQLVITV